ncbi:hypothetical protein CDAR_489241 [Caerostris darwini]|uniref:Uncharacterized protein n=1 Tax=Caerostris darwini TaxID=1538125 RepID=A0AAV4T0F3_9ARAC|nr:hypothetical protein CDAR_489241 [Caerostris darwini]
MLSYHAFHTRGSRSSISFDNKSNMSTFAWVVTLGRQVTANCARWLTESLLNLNGGQRAVTHSESGGGRVSSRYPPQTGIRLPFQNFVYNSHSEAEKAFHSPFCEDRRRTAVSKDTLFIGRVAIRCVREGGHLREGSGGGLKIAGLDGVSGLSAPRALLFGSSRVCSFGGQTLRRTTHSTCLI